MKMLVRLSLALVAAASLVAACGKQTDTKPGADHVFLNAAAYTLAQDAPWAEAVAVDDDRIVYVGDSAGAQDFIGSKTAVHDLTGEMLLPGFIDTHMHPISGGAYAKALSLDTFGTVDDWIASIGDYAKAHPEAKLIFGYGFLATTFGPTGPTRQMIDAVEGERPVLIMDEGFHGAWANTKALKALNITQDTPDLVPGFSYYKRDANGDATGYLLEGTAGKAMRDLNVITEDVVVDGTAYVIDTLNSYGVTALFDAGTGHDEDSLKRILERLESSGDLTVRIVGSYRPRGPEDAPYAVERAETWRNEVKGKHYHYRMLKIMDDGTIEGRTAAMFEDYQGEPGNSGNTVFTQAQMTSMISGAAAANLDVHVHALGERAINEALNAIEAARKAHPDTSSRFTICHIEVITDQDLPRFRDLDVIAQSTPLWASYDTYGKQFVSDDQFNRYFRFNSLKQLGVRLTFGSDYPASGAGMLGMSPILQMEIGHTRQAAGKPDAPIQPRESERLDIDSLIRGYTIDAAWQLRMEDEIGSLEVGKKADLVVLDHNLFDVDPYEIHNTRVLMTMLGGDVVYAAPGDE
jgi:predicted amidohydrolase YtcJ